VSVVTIYELRTGVEKCRRPNVELEKLVRFLEPFHVVPFNQDCANETARIRANLERRGKSIGPYDLLLAGQASAFQMTLITHNTGEFSRVEGLTIADWES
jgi:tRNA(fMet)-specific endonuclease VapC